MYLIRVGNGYLSVYHGTFKDEPQAQRLADRWNRMFKRRGQGVVAIVQPVLDVSAATRDQIVGSLLDDLQWRWATNPEDGPRWDGE